MPQCVVIDGGGHVVATAADPCTGFLLVDATEYAALQAFQAPTVEQAAQFFAGGFSTVVFSYLAAWGFQVILSMFSGRNR